MSRAFLNHLAQLVTNDPGIFQDFLAELALVCEKLDWPLQETIEAVTLLERTRDILEFNFITRSRQA